MVVYFLNNGDRRSTNPGDCGGCIGGKKVGEIDGGCGGGRSISGEGDEESGGECGVDVGLGEFFRSMAEKESLTQI